jgi:hypothetical protein
LRADHVPTHTCQHAHNGFGSNTTTHVCARQFCGKKKKKKDLQLLIEWCTYVCTYVGIAVA